MVRRRVRGGLKLSQLNVCEVEIPAKDSRLDGRAYPLRGDNAFEDTNAGPPSTCSLTPQHEPLLLGRNVVVRCSVSCSDVLCPFFEKTWEEALQAATEDEAESTCPAKENERCDSSTCGRPHKRPRDRQSTPVQERHFVGSEGRVQQRHMQTSAKEEACSKRHDDRLQNRDRERAYAREDRKEQLLSDKGDKDDDQHESFCSSEAHCFSTLCPSDHGVLNSDAEDAGETGEGWIHLQDCSQYSSLGAVSSFWTRPPVRTTGPTVTKLATEPARPAGESAPTSECGSDLSFRRAAPIAGAHGAREHALAACPPVLQAVGKGDCASARKQQQQQDGAASRACGAIGSGVCLCGDQIGLDEVTLDPRLVARPVIPFIYRHERTPLQHCEDSAFGGVQVGERACDAELAEGMRQENAEVLEALLVGQRVLRVLGAGAGREACWRVAACFFTDAYLRRLPTTGPDHGDALGGGGGGQGEGDRAREEGEGGCRVESEAEGGRRRRIMAAAEHHSVVARLRAALRALSLRHRRRFTTARREHARSACACAIVLSCMCRAAAARSLSVRLCSGRALSLEAGGTRAEEADIAVWGVGGGGGGEEEKTAQGVSALAQRISEVAMLAKIHQLCDSRIRGIVCGAEEHVGRGRTRGGGDEGGGGGGLEGGGGGGLLGEGRPLQRMTRGRRSKKDLILRVLDLEKEREGGREERERNREGEMGGSATWSPPVLAR
jgi:hypothetical protein